MLNHIMDVFPMIYNQEGASCSQILGGPDTGTDLLGHFDTFLFCSSKQLPCLRLKTLEGQPPSQLDSGIFLHSNI